VDEEKQTIFKAKGEYIIHVQYNPDGSIDIYSTDSPFWRDYCK